MKMDNSTDQKPADASQNNHSTDKSDSLKGRYAISRVCPNGDIADMVYLRDKGKARFAVAEAGNGDIHLLDTLLIDEEGNMTHDSESASQMLIPTKTVCFLVDKNCAYLAANAEDYGTIPDLYQQIRSFIQTYVILEDTRFYDVATGYILMTWVFDRFTTVPYLRVVGDMGTGKSRFLEVVGKLCYRSLLASGITTASIYRTLDIVQGTLVLDEADFKSSDMSDDIVKVLNAGHRKDSPIIRMEVVKEVMRPMPFRVFGPKLLGSRRSFSDTALESRCITQRLFPLKKTGVSVHLPPTFDVEAQMLRNKLLMFRFKNFHQIQDDESSLGGIEFPRLKQTALALTSIVKMVGDETLKSVLEFLLDCEKSLLDTVSTDSLADVLLCIARLVEFDARVKKTGKLYMLRISQEFNDRFYYDYAVRETKEIKTEKGPLAILGQVVSSRKVGTYVDNLGIAKIRDGHGIYIPLAQEVHRINSLIERYRLGEVLIQDRNEGVGNRYKQTPRTVAVEK